MANEISMPAIAVTLTLAAICFGLNNPGRVDAVPSQMSHEMSGVVQRINQQSLLITVGGASRPEVFAWNSKDTKFFRDGVPVTSDLLHAGTHVQIRCSHPLIGSEPLLYRVSWQTRSPKKNN